MRTDNEKYRFEQSNRSVSMGNIMKHGIIAEEFFNFICGKYLGWGASREVFEYKPQPGWVIKIDTGQHNSNVKEAEVWEHVCETELSKWFAPVKDLSPCGRILLQRKCVTGIPYDEYPKKIPEFFTDLKYSNWGKLKGNLVCFDYGNNLGLTTGLFTKKLKKADWWKD